MSGIEIKGTGMYVPNIVVTNDDFSKHVNTSDDWILSRTGIKQRYISDREPNWNMGLNASLNAIKDANISPSDLDLIIYTTVTPDYSTPSMSCIIQGMIKATNALCIDINCACSGFVYALDMSTKYLNSDGFKNVLIVSSETLSNIVDYSDRSTCVLFGDGAGSCVVSKSNSIFSSYLVSEGSGASHIFAHNKYSKSFFGYTSNTTNKINIHGYTDSFLNRNSHFLNMNGSDVYKFATKVIPISIKTACERASIDINDLDIIISHQANIRIIETAAAKLKISIDKFYINLDKYGNTSSASIPICISELKSLGKLIKGQKICVVGFGAGLTYGSAVFEW